MLRDLNLYSSLEYTTRAEAHRLLPLLEGRKNHERLDTVLTLLSGRSCTYITVHTMVAACVVTAFGRISDATKEAAHLLYLTNVDRLEPFDWVCYSNATNEEVNGNRTIKQISASLPKKQVAGFIKLYKDCEKVGNASTCSGNLHRTLQKIEVQQWHDIAVELKNGSTASKAMRHLLSCMNTLGIPQPQSPGLLGSALELFGFTAVPSRQSLKTAHHKFQMINHKDVGGANEELSALGNTSRDIIEAEIDRLEALAS